MGPGLLWAEGLHLPSWSRVLPSPLQDVHDPLTQKQANRRRFLFFGSCSLVPVTLTVVTTYTKKAPAAASAPANTGGYSRTLPDILSRFHMLGVTRHDRPHHKARHAVVVVVGGGHLLNQALLRCRV